MTRCEFIPPYLLERLAFSDLDVEISRCGHATLAIDAGLRAKREAGEGTLTTGGGWTVHTAANSSTLPGTPVRGAGQPASGDEAVDEAYDGLAASLALLGEVFGRASYDGDGAHVIATVHYEKNYDNAFWDGTQLVFGDGDGRVFGRFTKPVDVLGHELGHAVTEHSAGLVYNGQPGALNESISDVIGAMVKQRLLGQTAEEADWLIGEGLFLPHIEARGLRDMLNPGTAYDDPVLGKDPQGASMSDYVVTREDNGGVHLNSGIPNRAFALAARELGGRSWETAGPIWYSALTSGLAPTTDFATFATATIEAAGPASDVVAAAWAAVGVGGDVEPTIPEHSREIVSVSRTGGFAGLKAYGEVRLGQDPRSEEVVQLLGSIDLDRVRSGDQPQPDRFVYAFSLRGRDVVVPEQALTPELAKLASLVLHEG